MAVSQHEEQVTTNLVCRACQATFISPPRSEKRIRCPACGEVHPSTPKKREIAKSNSGGLKCPGCKRVMARGVNYCVACNLSLFDAWGDAEKDASVAGRRNEVRGYAELAAKTVRIFVYFITLRWDKILGEF